MYIETVLKNHHWELFCAFNLEYHIYIFIKSTPKQEYSIKFYHKQYGCNSFKTMSSIKSKERVQIDKSLQY